MADTLLTLGDFVFANLEIPEVMPFGGEQMLAIHKLVGGARQIDSLGPDDAPLSWSGIFQELSGMPRARYLDGLRRAGDPLVLTWDAFRYSVVIKSFACNFKRYWHAPYQITCEVIEDLTNPINYIVLAPADVAINGDMASLNGLSDALGSIGITPAVVNAVQDAIGQLNTVVAAAAVFGFVDPVLMSKVQGKLYGAQNVVSGAIAVTNGDISGITSAGGVLAGLTGNQNAENLLLQANTFVAVSNLTGMQANLNRMGQNIALLPSN